MVSSGRRVIACILLSFGTAVYSQAQTSPAKNPSASVSGKVTVKGKGVAGVVVFAVETNYGGAPERAHRAVTDDSGNYRISNLPDGKYRVAPHSLSFVVENQQTTNELLLSEAESVENINFALVRGGVITGKITDSEGEPAIEEHVNVILLNDQGANMRFNRGMIQTDDRGIYRAFGLRAGKYRVSVGQGEYGLPNPGRSYRQTFYPSTTDEAKATVIEVSEGGEISDVDIVMAGRARVGVKVTGRIIDGKSGKPLPNVVYGIIRRYGEGSSSTSGATSDANGEFKFENVLPGKYEVYIEQQQNSDTRANRVSFEVTDQDISGLTIKTVKGASLSGVIVLESTGETLVTKKPGELHLFAWVDTPDRSTEHYSAPSALIKPDGSFRISGLSSGVARISMASADHNGVNTYGIARIERDGIAQPDGINVKDGEDIVGLRVFLKQFSGAIRGEVKIEGGELPPSSRLSLSLARLDDPSGSIKSYQGQEIDSRGRFRIQGLAAGRYEVRVMVFMSVNNYTNATQEVTVAENAVSDVVVTLKLKPSKP